MFGMKNKRSTYRCGLVLFCSCWLIFVSSVSTAIIAKASTEVPIAQSVPIAGAIPSPGSVISYLEAQAIYTVSATASDPAVFGVAAERPAIVFVSATNTVPVITRGVGYVRVSSASEVIERGDLLTSADVAGQATRAAPDEQNVFAIALERVDPSNIDQVLADIGVERAQAYQAAQVSQIDPDDENTDSTATLTWLRPVLAAALVLGAFGFLLYSFRSILAAGIQSVGRNPRARRAVIVSAVLSFVILLIVTVLVLLAAIGVLVLPVTVI